MEKHIDFWAAYLLPTCVLAVSIIPVMVLNGRLGEFEPVQPAIWRLATMLMIL